MSESKYKVSWSEVSILADLLHADIIKSGINYTAIYGIPRGGVILGVMLSHKLNIPLASSPEEFITYKNDGYHILIVDEINDTGETLSQYGSQHTAVLHQRMTSKYSCKFVGKLLTKETPWIEYPWES